MNTSERRTVNVQPGTEVSELILMIAVNFPSGNWLERVIDKRRFTISSHNLYLLSDHKQAFKVIYEKMEETKPSEYYAFEPVEAELALFVFDEKKNPAY